MASGRTRRFLITGLAALLPTMLTAYLLYVVVVAIHEHIGTKVNVLFGIEEESWRVFLGDAIALLVFIALAWLAGFMLATYLGRLLFRRFDASFHRIPLIRIVYPAVKQVTDFFLTKRTLPFSRVVAVEYPRRGIYSIGFLTGEGLSELVSEDGERLVTVFIPNTPAPLTGFAIMVPRKDVITLNLSVDGAIKFIVSGGVVVPDAEALEAKRALAAEGARPAPETKAVEG